MCNLNKRYLKRSFTGYKAAVLDTVTGKIRSIATYLEYKVGRVAALSEKRAVAGKHSLDRVYGFNRPFANPLMMVSGSLHVPMLSGRTAAFDMKSKNRAVRTAMNSRPVVKRYVSVLIRITLADSDGLVMGTYDDGVVVAGDTIRKIAVVKAYENDSRY